MQSRLPDLEKVTDVAYRKGWMNALNRLDRWLERMGNEGTVATVGQVRAAIAKLRGDEIDGQGR